MRNHLYLCLLLVGCYLEHHEAPDVRTTVVKPIGVITQPNKYGSYPDGALSQGKNVHLRKPGVLSSVPVPEVYKSDALASSQIARRIWAGASKLLVASDDNSSTKTLRWVDASASDAISGTSGLTYSHGVGKVQAFQHLGRWYVTADTGVMAIASEGATTFALAGFAPPRVITAQSVTATDASSIEAVKTASWKALFVRKSATGEIIKIGPPSTAVRIDNTLGATVNFTFRVQWPTSVSANLLAGDFLELYRTPTQDTGTDPGEDYFLAATVALTSTDLSNKYADIQDASSDAALGAELYTNEDQDGETAIKFAPGLAVDAAMFKGSAFYVTQKVAGFHEVRVPAAWGTLSSNADRAHGIGKREVTATVSSGSAVLTGVSNMRGIAAGQLIDDGAGGTLITAGTTVSTVNVGASTITMSANAIGSGAATITTTDVIEIDGAKNSAAHPYTLLNAIGTGIDSFPVFDQAAHIQATASAPVLMYGVAMTVQTAWYRYGPPTIRASNGQNYSPPLPLLTETVVTGSTDTRLNRLQISEPDQPEAVAVGPGNELLVGSGEIYRILATTDALWVFASDGLWRVSGTYPDWRVDPVDPDLTIASRTSVGVLKGAVWSYGPRGLVVFTDGSRPEEISNGVVGDQIPGAVFGSSNWNTSLVCDDANDEVHVVTINGSTDSIGWTFNTLTKAFTSTTYQRTGDTYSTAHAYAPYLRALVWGAVQASAADIIRAGSNPLIAMAGAAVDYQPITGDGDPFTLKNWLECNYAFVPNADGFTILPRFDGTSFDASITLAIPYTAGPLEGRGAAGMPEGSALSTMIAPGFTIATAGSNSAWDFRGLSLIWMPAAEESR